MGKAGAQRKAGKREANGRLQRPSLAEMKRIEQIKREGEKVTVLNQPHRRGDAREDCSSAFGRFILRRPEERRTAMKHAGDNYATAVRGWRAAKGIPTTVRHSEPSAGIGASDETIVRWYRTMVEADREMSRASHDGWLYVRQLLLDDYDIGMDQDGPAVLAIEALAIHFGMMTANRHPYRAG